MRLSRRGLALAAPLLGLAACTPTEPGEPRTPDSPDPTEGGSSTPMETETTAETAAPRDPALRFHAPPGLAVDGEQVHALGPDALVTWSADGRVTRALAHAETGLTVTDATRWSVRDGIAACTGGAQYSLAIVDLAAGALLGTVEVEGSGEDSGEPGSPSSSPFLPATSCSTDGTNVALTWPDGTVLVVDTVGKELHRMRPEGLTEGDDVDVRVQHAGGRLVVFSPSGACPLQRWRADGAELVDVLDDAPGRVARVLPGDDTHFLVTRYPDDEFAVELPCELRAAEDGSVRSSVTVPTEPHSPCALSPDGATVATARASGRDARFMVRLTRLDGSGETPLETPERAPQALAFAADGASVLALTERFGVTRRALDGEAQEDFELP